MPGAFVTPAPPPPSLFLRGLRLLRPWHTVTLWARPFCWVLSHFPLLPFPPSTSASWSSSGPPQVRVLCTLPAPCRVLFCIYVVVVVLISFFLCVLNIMHLRNTHVFEWTLLHLFWLLHGTLSFYRPSVNRLQLAVLSLVRCQEAFYLFLAVLCLPLLLCGLFLRGCPLASHCSGFSCCGA